MTKIQDMEQEAIEEHFDPEQLRVLKMLPLDSDKLHAIAREMVEKQIKKRADAVATEVGNVDEDKDEDCDPGWRCAECGLLSLDHCRRCDEGLLSSS